MDKLNPFLASFASSFALHRTTHVQFMVIITQIVHLRKHVIKNPTTLVAALVVRMDDGAKSAPFDGTSCHRWRPI
jgi:hypothetical protein